MNDSHEESTEAGDMLKKFSEIWETDLKVVQHKLISNRDTPKEERKKIGIGDIWLNSATCNQCREIVESTHEHDFAACKCGKLAVDGGSWYVRRAFESPYEDRIELYRDAEEELLSKSGAKRFMAWMDRMFSIYYINDLYSYSMGIYAASEHWEKTFEINAEEIACILSMVAHKRRAMESLE